MSHYYATIEGARSPKTCQGSKRSGLRAAAQSWSGSLIVEFDHDEETDETIARIGVGQGSTTRIDRTLWSGPLAALMAADHIELYAGPAD